MTLITKTYMAVACMLFLTQIATAQKTAILESSSIYTNHTMDGRWLSKCQSLGLDAQIVDYSFLNNSCLIDDAEIIIISSGVMFIDPIQQDNLEEFVASGGALYLQSEWNYALPGNVSFTEMADYFGDSFAWVDSIKLQLAPVTIFPPLNSNYNNVNFMGYFWSGASGSYTGPFQPILRSSGMDVGYIYKPTQAQSGTIVTITDQDWVRLYLEDFFLENIIDYLRSQVQVLPTVFITADNESPCQGEDVHFFTQIFGQAAGVQYQWYQNGSLIPGAQDEEFIASNPQDGDVFECEIQFTYGCRAPFHVSNPILIAPIFAASQDSLDISIVQVDSCAGSVINFDLQIDNPDNVTIQSYEWFVNGNSVANSSDPTLAIKDLQANDGLVCQYTFDDPCGGTTTESTPVHLVALEAAAIAAVAFESYDSLFCANDAISYQISGEGWGLNPTINWYLAGQLVQSGQISFSAPAPTLGSHILEVVVESSLSCIEEAVANEIHSFVVQDTDQISGEILSDTEGICAGSEAAFYIVGDLGTEAVIDWRVDGTIQPETGMELTVSEYYPTMDITAEITTTENCIENPQLLLAAPIIAIVENLTPTVAIDANPMKVCPGTEVSLQASGNNWGNNPQLEWYLDGMFAAGGTYFTFNPETTTLVQFRVISDLPCVDNNIEVSDPYMVEVSDLSLSLVDSTSEHCGQSDGSLEVMISGGIGTITGNWLNGSTSLTLENMSAGTYSFLAADEIGCTALIEGEIIHEEAPIIEDLKVFQPHCEQPLGQAELSMAGPVNAYEIIWMNEQLVEVGEGSIVSGLDGGSYLVEVMDQYGCVAEQSLEIVEVETVQISEPEVLEITLGESVVLEPTILSSTMNLQYEWDSAHNINCFDCESLEDTPMESTRYFLTVTNEEGCSATTEFLVRVKKDYEIYLPTAFSPNSDGSNDHYMPFTGVQASKVNSLSIFNRWGEMVFQIDDPVPGYAGDGWNGLYRGQKAPIGTYVVMAEVLFEDGETRIQTTDMQLIR
ncbi:MAG: T9SS type B sorting domain-containing protein [Saprospiraceae bacterium]|nr:T9SS type B sorting domain-containing protein [Saprospiraceae bacterium]